MRSSSIFLAFLQAEAVLATQCEIASSTLPTGFRCGMIDGVHISCNIDNYCSTAGWCGESAAWRDGADPNFSTGNCPPTTTPDPANFFGIPATCQSCAFNVTALEEFSVDYTAVIFAPQNSDSVLTGYTTSPLPDTFPSEHGTIAVHARNLQLKLDSHAAFPTPFALGSLPVSGMQIHEELHINGATGQASFHLESPIVNLCFQLDHLPPVTQAQHDLIESQLQQAEQIAPAIMQQQGVSMSVDGEHVVGIQGDDYGEWQHAALFTDSTHPKFFASEMSSHERDVYQHVLSPPPSDALLDRLALKFDNYSSSVGNQFGVRACEIESQTATQSLLATNPKAQEFMANRIVRHQRRLQALLQPAGLNTRFNFIPLEIADLMVPAAQHCTNEELAQIPHKALSTLQAAAFSVCSFVIGIAATLGASRKKTVTLADDYHQVSA